MSENPFALEISFQDEGESTPPMPKRQSVNPFDSLMQSQASDTAAELDEVKSELARSQTQLGKAQEDIKTKNKTIDDLLMELETLQGDIEPLQKSVKAIPELEKAAAQCEPLAQQVKVNEKIIGEQRVQIESLSQQLARAQSEASKVIALQAEINQLKAEIKALKDRSVPVDDQPAAATVSSSPRKSLPSVPKLAKAQSAAESRPHSTHVMLRKSSKVIEITNDTPVDASIRRHSSSSSSSDFKRKDDVTVDTTAQNMANARAVFLAKTAPKDDPRTKVTRRTSAVLTTSAPAPGTITTQQGPGGVITPSKPLFGSSGRTPSQPAPPPQLMNRVSAKEKRLSAGIVIEENPLPSTNKTKAFIDKFAPVAPHLNEASGMRGQRSATVSALSRPPKSATTSAPTAAPVTTPAASKGPTFMKTTSNAPAPIASPAPPVAAPAPEPIKFQPPTSTAGILEASNLPQANKAKAFQEKFSAAEPAVDEVAMRAQRANTMGARPKSVLVKGNQTGCGVCGQPVFQMEKLETDGVTYHKKCFRCEVCKKAVSLQGFAALEGKVYCKPHFKQLFALKGNYNEGFGTEQHKYKWTHSQGASEV